MFRSPKDGGAATDAPPESEIGKLAKHSSIYLLGVMLGRVANFLMLPIYTRYLTPRDYGMLELLSMTIDLFGIFAGAALGSAVFRFYVKYKEVTDKNEVLSTAVIATMSQALAAALIGLAAAPLLSTLILNGHESPTYFRLFFLIFLAQKGEVVPLLVIRSQNRSTLFIVINTLRLVSLLALNIFFVVVKRMGVTGVLLSNLIVSSIFSVGLLLFLFRRVPVRFSWPKFKAMAVYGYPLGFVSLGNFFLVFSDRYFLNHFTTTADVGRYALAYRFAFVLSAFVFAPFFQVWGPQRFTISKRPDAKDIYRRVFTYLNLALGGAALLISLFVHDAVRIMAAPAFHASYQVVPLILVAQILHHWTSFGNFPLMLKDKTRNVAWANAAGIAAVLGLNLLLIPPFGVYGAATATIAAYLVRFLLVHGLANRLYPIPFAWAHLARLYAILVSIAVIRYMLPLQRLTVSVPVSIALAVIAAVLVYKLVLLQGDRLKLRELLFRVRGRLAAVTPF